MPDPTLLADHLAAERPRCPDCRYRLDGAASSRCPECGGTLVLRLHPADLRGRALGWWLLGVLAGLAVIPGLALWWAWGIRDPRLVGGGIAIIAVSAALLGFRHRFLAAPIPVQAAVAIGLLAGTLSATIAVTLLVFFM